MSHFAAQKQFWEAPGDHFGLPGRSIFGTWARCNTTAGSPILGRKKNFWEALGDHFGFPQGCIVGTWARCITTAGSPILGRKSTFGRLPGIILGFPGPGRAVSKPGIILAFWEFIIKDTPAH